VELAIIKLCYLQQALTITAEGNMVSKKKVIDAAKPVAFRQIRPFAVSGEQSAVSSQQSIASGEHSAVISKRSVEAKLIIETEDLKNITVKEDEHKYNVKGPANEQQATGNAQHLSDKQVSMENTPATKISALDKIRKQYKTNGNKENGKTNHPLQEDELQKAWSEYVQQLRDAKNSAASSFAYATLRINDENCFEAVTANNIEKQFIEQERNQLFSFLQHRLNNRLLQITVIIEENTQDRPAADVPLSSKDQFLKMAEEYPMVRELKERLKLDLDY
jgi:DNA polymerase-3 subunit gamma/tau